MLLFIKFYFKSSIYFFNCFDSGPSIIFTWLSISTIPLAPNFCIPSLFTSVTSLRVALNLDKLTSVFIMLSFPQSAESYSTSWTTT